MRCATDWRRWAFPSEAYADVSRADGAVASRGPPIIQFVHLNNRSRFSDAVIYAPSARRTRQTAGRSASRNGHPADLCARLPRSRDVRGRQRGRPVRPARDREAGRARHVVHRDRRRLHRRQRFFGDRRSARVSEDQRRRSRQRIPRDGSARPEPGMLAELYKPLGDELKWIVVPKLFAERQQPDRVQSIKATSSDRSTSSNTGGSFQMGREFWRHAALFARHPPLRRYHAGSRRRPDGAERRISMAASGSSTGRGIASTTGTFRRAARTRTSSISGRAPSLGADNEFEQVSRLAVHGEDVGAAHVPARRTARPHARRRRAGAEHLSRAAAYFACRDSNPNELSGQNFGMALLGYRYKLFATGWLPPYVGMTLEYGNTAEHADDILDEGLVNAQRLHGIQFAARTAVHRIRIRQGGHRAYFLRIGNILGSSSDRRLDARRAIASARLAGHTASSTSRSRIASARRYCSSIRNTRATFVSGRNLRNFFR